MRLLVDEDTQAVAVQGDLEGYRVTVMIEGDHKLRRLRGRAFVAIEAVTVAVDDHGWDAILGNAVVVHGGGELRVRDDALDQALEAVELDDPDAPLGEVLIPLEIDDTHYPQAGVIVRYSDLCRSFNEIDPGSGPRHARGLSDCENGADRRREKCSCSRCFYEWWRAKARERGIDVDG